MVMPKTADGWLEQMAMDAARVQLVREIAKAKHGDRLKVYYPRTETRRADLCPREDRDRRRPHDPRWIGQHEQPLDGAR